MKTNNQQLKQLHMTFMIELILLSSLFICLQLSYINFAYLFLFVLLLTLIFSHYQQNTILKNMFQQIRDVIDFIDQQREEVIMEGDIGLLYDRVSSLKKRINAYSLRILEEKNKLKETIENICHQMKTPLASISINNELLMEMIDDQRLTTNQQQIEKMKYFLTTFLTLIKLDNHTLTFEYQKLPLHYLIDLSLQHISTINQHCQIYNHIQDIEFYYDENWLVEAIVNILKNALEQESVHNITITNEIIGQYLKIYIQDDGQGIDKKDLSHLFERFYQSQNQKQNNMGIGLSLAQEIIHYHHGYIQAYNNQGACFELTIPLIQVSSKIEL